MIVMLITLLAINIVASSIFGAPMSRSINRCLLILESFNLLLSVGDNEKKAISEPEISPEQINNIMHDIKGVKKL